MALWGGRFSGGPAQEMQEFGESLGVDMRMFEQDIRGSKAHARMLAEVGLLDGEERDQILSGLERVAEELRAGSWRPGIELEDIHMAVETRLGEHIGEPRREAAHGALTQRSGGHGPAALDAGGSG